MRLIETCLYAKNLDEVERFYREVFGLEVYAKKEGAFVFFKCKNGMLLIFNPEHSLKNVDIPKHGCMGNGHVAFAMDHDEVEFWKSKLKSLGIRIECEYTWSNGARSIYLRDPAGNSVELITPDAWGYNI